MNKRSAIVNRLFRVGICVVIITSVMANFASTAHALPQPPNWFHGNVTINGTRAPAGTIISASIGGLEYESGLVDAQGRYGYDESNPFRVPADDPETAQKEGGTTGDTVDFYVAGVHAASVSFQVGAFTELNLAITSAMQAELSISEQPDNDGVVTIPVGVARIKDSVTGETISGIPIRCYVASAFYNPSGMKMLNVRCVSPFCNPTISIYPAEGRADCWFCTPGAGVAPPFTLAKLVPRLTGCATNSYTIEVVLSVNQEPGSPTIIGDSPRYLTFQRGDTNGNGVVNIIDAMFGAQYLVGLRPFSDIRPLNLASVRHDDSGDVMNIIDCMYIAQYVVGIRDCLYQVAP